MSTSITELQQQLAQAEANEKARQDREYAEHQRREVAAADERLSSYDRDRYAREANEAWQRFLQVFEETPAFAALADAQAAKWRAHRAAHAAVLDRTTIARARGDELPRPYDGRPPEALGLHTILSVLEAMLRERMDGDEEAEQQAMRDAVARDLTPEQRQQAEAHLKAGEVKASDEPSPDSIDVTGMSDAERVKLGLPPGMSSRRRGVNVTRALLTGMRAGSEGRERGISPAPTGLRRACGDTETPTRPPDRQKHGPRGRRLGGARGQSRFTHPSDTRSETP
jgi:hypothetical protein